MVELPFTLTCESVLVTAPPSVQSAAELDRWCWRFLGTTAADQRFVCVGHWPAGRDAQGGRLVEAFFLGLVGEARP